MSLLSLIVVLAIIGAVMWAINTQVTFIDDKFKRIINFVAIVVVAIWLLSLFGILPDLNAIRVGG